jgi:uncharacterized hydrophobic protein (TIGR00341 family)
VRLVQVTIPTGKREAILDALDDEGVDYVVTDETSSREFTGVVYVPLPIAAVEPVLERLREAGVDEDAYTVVLEANTVVSRRFDELTERYSEDDDEQKRISRDELRTEAAELAPDRRNYAIMTVISSVIATAGLLLDSPATVVGSMVIAPLIGPAMAASVGTVLDDRDMFVRGVKLQAAGLLLAVLAAAAFAFLVRYANLVPFAPSDVTALGEVRERLAPDFLSLAVALGAGVAGALSLAIGVRSAIVGVMIAVALIPPAATVGIGLAWGLPMASLGSGVLALINGLSINFAALLVLWYIGYRPEKWFRLDEARTATVKRVVTLAVAIAVLSVFLGGVTFGSMQATATESAINSGVQAVVDQEANESVVLLETQVDFTDGVIQRQTDQVIVTVGVPPTYDPHGLADRIDRRVNQAASADVETQVRFVTTVSVRG